MKPIINQTIILLFIMAEISSCTTTPGNSHSESGFIGTQSSKLYYEVLGQGEPVILLHPGLSDSRIWDYQIEKLSEKYKVIRIDSRGYGKSGVPENDYSTNDDILELYKHLGLQKATIIGICMGALQGIDFTVNYPDKVKSLIISSPNFTDWQYPKEIIANFIEFSKTVSEKGPDVAIEKLMNEPFWNKSFPAKEYTKAREYYMKILIENKKSFTVNWHYLKITPDLYNRLNEIQCPVLLILPENDLEYLKPVSHEIVSKIKNIDTLKIEKAGHLSNMEKPEEFNRAVLNFLEKNKK